MFSLGVVLYEMLADLGGMVLPDSGNPTLRPATCPQTTPQPSAAMSSASRKRMSHTATPGSSPTVDSEPEFDDTKPLATGPATLKRGRRPVVKRSFEKNRTLYNRVKADPNCCQRYCD